MTVKDLILELSRYPQGANIHNLNNVRMDSNGLVYLYHLPTPEEIAKEQRLMGQERERINGMQSRERVSKVQKTGKEIENEGIEQEYDRYMSEKIRDINRVLGF